MPLPSWYFKLSDEAKFLYGNGAKTPFLSFADAQPLNTEFTSFQHRNREFSASKQAGWLDHLIRFDLDDIPGASYLIVSSPTDSNAIMLGLGIAIALVGQRRDVEWLNLADTASVSKIGKIVERNGSDLILTHNLTEASTQDRFERARDVLTLETPSVVIAAGDPSVILSRLFCRVSAVLYHDVSGEYSATDSTDARVETTPKRVSVASGKRRSV